MALGSRSIDPSTTPTAGLTAADKRGFLGGVVLLAILGVCWALAFFYAPEDAFQGQVYRIMFMHVPAAFTAFFSSLILCLFSIWGLAKRHETALRWSKACAEVGLLFTVMTLATGSIWGRPTWGTWWTWDARLTTTFLLAILYAGYLFLHSSLEPGPQRVRICAVLGIIIFADVPIIYKSVTWWRTLHQPPSLLRPGGSTMDPTMRTVLLCNALALMVVAAWMMVQRARNLRLKDELDDASYETFTRG